MTVRGGLGDTSLVKEQSLDYPTSPQVGHMAGEERLLTQWIETVTLTRWGKMSQYFKILKRYKTRLINADAHVIYLPISSTYSPRKEDVKAITTRTITMTKQ